MTRHSIEPRDRIFLNVHGFLSFPKNMSYKIGKNISQNLNIEYRQKHGLLRRKRRYFTINI